MPKKEGDLGLSVSLNTEAMQVSVSIVKGTGKDKSVIETKDFDLADVAETLQPDVSLYGLSKILQDRTSDVTDKREKLLAMSEVMERLSEGEWAKERVGGSPTVSPEVEALADIKGISIPQAQKSLKNYDPEKRKKILGNAKVVAKAATIKAARLEAKEVSLDDLA